jgi:phosphohistidine swiveling domain-containing protein
MLAIAFAVLAEQLDLITPDRDEIRQACTQIKDLVTSANASQAQKIAARLVTLLQEADAADNQDLADLLAHLLPRLDSPWPLLKTLCTAEDPDLAARGIGLALSQVQKGHLPCDAAFLSTMARLARQEDGPFDDLDLLEHLKKTIDRHHGARGAKGLHQLLGQTAEPDLRELAARLLDMDEKLPTPTVCRKVLGARAWQILGPYLHYTRARHADLICLTGPSGVPGRMVDEFEQAGQQHGAQLVRQVVAHLGWARVNQGLHIEELVRLEWEGTAPLFVRPEETALFATDPAPELKSTCHLVQTKGSARAAKGPAAADEKVDRFRRINITHAELLSEMLETAPCTRPKVVRILALMDQVVTEFTHLFADTHEEYAILPDVWRQLRQSTDTKLKAQKPGDNLTADLVRLVMAFEDPANLGEVRTVHGLKRLLHQKGLKLGFDLVGTGDAPNCTVDLLLLPAVGEPVAGPSLRYVELEPAPEPLDQPWLPYPVRLAADGLSWQLLHGTTSFPGLDVFIFGNEVHYYVTFRNHPAFLRVDFSPPQRGGMLDLEYYGVSSYETGIHPNLELDAICQFYRAMELEVRVEGTRLFVRYDKERSHSLADLQDKVAALLRFTPFLMDVDWVVGSLQLPGGLKQTVVNAWAERFARSGLFPVNSIVTSSRRQILLQRKLGPEGEVEIPWSGKGNYADCWQGETPPDLWDCFLEQAQRLGLPTPTTEARELAGPLPLRTVHRHILEPVRRRVRSGQIIVNKGRLEPCDPRLCQQEHETAFFARQLGGRSSAAHTILAEAVTMAPVVAHLEKFIPLQATGYVGGLRIERGRLTLRGGEVRIYAARDSHGVIRLGVFSHEDRLLRTRSHPRAAWRTNAATDAERLWALLRSANYVGDSPHIQEPDPRAAVKELRHLAQLPGPGPATGLATAANVLEGIGAAPGRVTGRALFGTGRHRPEDLVGSLLVAREIRPSDSRHLLQSAGIVSTGGAVLSHAALLAIQFGKPALVVEADWDETGHVPALVFRATLYRTQQQVVAGLQVCRRSVTSHTTGRLEEGDLCILDTGQQVLRILGQDPDTLVLWQGFQLLGRAQAQGQQTSDPQQILESRAQLLRARHQIKKALGRISSDTVADLAVEEIVLGQGPLQLGTGLRAEFLGEILANPAVRDRVVPRLQELVKQLDERCRGARDREQHLTPGASFLFEILGWRLRSRQLADSLEMIRDLEGRAGLPADMGLPPAVAVDDGPARKRITTLARDLVKGLGQGDHLDSHRLRRLARLHQVKPATAKETQTLATAAEKLAARDQATLTKLRRKNILVPGECGLETHPLLGWKGANLAELDRLAGPEATPPWFALSDTAFRLMLRQQVPTDQPAARHLPPGQHTLAEAIAAVLALPGADCGAKSQLIEQLWDTVPVPERLAKDIARAHQRLTQDSETSAFLALRSSSCDEDSESSMQAGVYDTFLYVQGLASTLAHLRLTWAGMWTERALFARALAGDIGRQPVGGVVVQRMVDARVSGVMQTVNVAGGDLNELVISVGLGLGEGIVSGLVAADMVTVVKDQGPDRDPVHFNYLTNDKPQQMVFDKRRGSGTRLVDTLYHQRLRPAIEYTELCEMTRKALALEAVYGYPLDLEFAIEGDRFWLLQARPITAILAEHALTCEKYPLQKPATGRQAKGD